MKPCKISEAAKDRGGYANVRIYDKMHGHHRVAYCEFHGLTLAAIEGKVVRHACDNPPCIEPTHLLLGTHKENMEDKVARGRCPDFRGEAHPQVKLTEDDVRAIRERYIPRCRVNGTRALAREYHVHQTHISGIIRNKTWHDSQTTSG